MAWAAIFALWFHHSSIENPKTPLSGGNGQRGSRRQAVVSGGKKQPAAARQGKPLANHIGCSSNCSEELCRLHRSNPVVQIFAPTGTHQFPPLTLGGNG